MLTLPDSVGKGIMCSGCPCVAFVHLFVRSSRQILLPRYLMNYSSNRDETRSEYLLAPIDELIRFWKSKVKCQGHSRRGEGIHVDAGALKCLF